VDTPDEPSGSTPYLGTSNCNCEDKETLMLKSTPEYVSAHVRGLADKPLNAGPELIARYRRERRQKRALFAAAVYRAIPFVNRPSRSAVIQTVRSLGTGAGDVATHEEH
jgi:hypothetical protein